MFDQLFVVQLPLGDGIVVFRDPRHGEDRIPELLKGLFFGKFREHCFGPVHRRHADHAPLAFVVHGVADQVGHLGIISPVRGFDLLAVCTGHDAGLVGEDRYVAGSAVVLVLGLVVLPLRDLREHFHGLILIRHQRQVVVMPLDADIFCAGFVRAFRDHFHKSGVLHVRVYDDRLVLLHVCAFSHHKFG